MQRVTRFLIMIGQQITEITIAMPIKTAMLKVLYIDKRDFQTSATTAYIFVKIR